MLLSFPPQRQACHRVYRQVLDVTNDGQTRAVTSITGGLWLNTSKAWHCVSRNFPPLAAVRFVN